MMMKRLLCMLALTACACSAASAADGDSYATPYGRLLKEPHEISLAFKVKTTGSVMSGTLVRQTAGSNGFSLSVGPGQNGATSIQNSNLALPQGSIDFSKNPGTPKTLVIVASNKEHRAEIYVDGQKVASSRGGNVIGQPNWRQLQFGGAGGGNRGGGFGGGFGGGQRGGQRGGFGGAPQGGQPQAAANPATAPDILASGIWNRALTEAEIKGLDLTKADFAWDFEQGGKILAGNVPVYKVSAQQPRVTGTTVAPEEPLTLWYRNVPGQWTDMTPIGNGYMGGMIAGRPEHEYMILNEGTLWAGGPYDHLNKNASAEKLAELRQAVFDGNGNKANQIAQSNFLSKPTAELPFSVAGVLDLDQNTGSGDITDYIQKLDIGKSIATTSFTRNGIKYTREYLASYPDHVIAVRLTADKPGAIDLSTTIGTPQDYPDVKVEGRDIVLKGRAIEWNGIQGKTNFEIRARVFNEGGKCEAGPKSADGSSRVMLVSKANAVTILLTIATSYVNYEDVSADPAARVAKVMAPFAQSVDYNALKAKHIKDYQSLFNRVSVDFGKASNNLPTNERLNERRQGKPLDPNLAALYFQFGRYLLISSSRPGGQPANLQGIWSEEVSVPWESKYTININAEMNYWPAELTNLSECHEPLFEMIESMVPNGRKAAKQLYQIDNGSWVAHHNTDLWRQCGPIDLVPTGMWPMGGAWLCLHYWEHYQYTRDTEELKKYYPVIRDAAKFYLKFLIPDPKHNGVLVTNPSYSPEQGPLVASPTMDTGILYALFNAAIESSKVLNIDADLRKEFTDTMAKFPPFKIGSWGQLMEWQDELRDDNPNNKHRHISHLFAIFPGNVINYDQTDLFQAARKSLVARGDDATGWSMGWKINLWARMRDGNHTWKLISNLIHPDRTYNNMFDAHPPFQIDGNFGGAAGIAEMLLQSHEVTKDGKTVANLLPALPDAIATGSITGLKARGGATIDLSWENGKLTKAVVADLKKVPFVVSYNGKTIDLSSKTGSVTLTAADFK